MTPGWLTSLDDGFAAGLPGKREGRQGEEAVEFSPAALSALTATANVPNGFYTLTLPDGGHRTFRVHTQNPRAKFAPGKRIIGLLIGPDNTSDYEGVGFLEAGGVRVWKRFTGQRVEIHVGVLWELMSGGAVEGCELAVSKRCLACNRVLSDPESIGRGVGPLCWERMRHGK